MPSISPPFSEAVAKGARLYHDVRIAGEQTLDNLDTNFRALADTCEKRVLDVVPEVAISRRRKRRSRSVDEGTARKSGEREGRWRECVTRDACEENARRLRTTP